MPLFVHCGTSKNLMTCRISNFRRAWRGTAARAASDTHRMAYRPAATQKNKNDRMAVSHTVIGRYRTIRQEVSNFDFMGILCFYWGRAFFDKLYKYNNAPDMAIPPLGRQIQNIRRRFFISNRRSSQRIAVTSAKRSRKCNGFIFHLLANYFYICFSRSWHEPLTIKSEDVGIKLLFVLQLGLYRKTLLSHIRRETAREFFAL